MATFKERVGYFSGENSLFCGRELAITGENWLFGRRELVDLRVRIIYFCGRELAILREKLAYFCGREITTLRDLRYFAEEN